MFARVFLVISVHAIIMSCVTMNGKSPEIISKSKVELTPILIESGLNDIVVLSPPILNSQAIYYLHKPNGDALRLNLKNKTDTAVSNTVDGPQFKIFNINQTDCCNETDVDTIKSKMKPYDFIIGPLQEEDHGNWVLSAYFKDIDEHWVELYQVITLEIIEQVPLTPEETELKTGDTFILSFAYPLLDLESCQLELPTTTVDRYYDRIKTGLNKCEFIMKNVSLADEGTWRIFGVGRIVYKGSANLHISDRKYLYLK